MIINICEIINLTLSAVVGGMYWGPWLALSRSLDKFEPSAFLAVVRQLNLNMAPIMTVLSPLSLLTTAIMAVLYSFSRQYVSLYFTLGGLLLFAIAVMVTVAIEVPIVKQIVTWTEATLPVDWQQQRDKWQQNHVLRVWSGLIGLVLLLCATILQ